jgi:hypothetical protein
MVLNSLNYFLRIQFEHRYNAIYMRKINVGRILLKISFKDIKPNSSGLVPWY